MDPQPRSEDREAEARLRAAGARDELAHARDLAALSRDLAAEARNRVMARRDAAHVRDEHAHAVTGAEVIVRAAGQRKRAARHRAQAAEQGVLAEHDRHESARDREEAARERLHALADREILARQLAITEIDPLTGARARAAGLVDLDHELDRCRRSGGALVVAYVDIVGLKSINDTAGHAAGDELLTRVVGLIQTHLRSYDLIIRLGGDEFLCAMSDVSLPDARERFDAVSAELAGASDKRAIRTGFAELTADQTAANLIECADSDLIEGRDASRRGPGGSEPLSARPETGEQSRGAGLSLTLRGGTSAPVRARAALSAFVGDIDLEQLELLELLISELVTNSVVHGCAGARQRISVQVSIRSRTVHGEVSDWGPGFVADGPPVAREIGGLGLVIVDRTTNRWGNSHDGRRVWFEMDRYNLETPEGAPQLNAA
jgi:diguanylate cyclase (GGDEF)-like protein